MHRMITLSLLLNIAVLAPVGSGLAFDTEWVARAYGESMMQAEVDSRGCLHGWGT